MGLPHPGIEKVYKGRNAAVMAVNIALERDAVRILRLYAPGPKGYGKLLSRLLYEHEARESTSKMIRENVRQALRKATREATIEGNND